MKNENLPRGRQTFSLRTEQRPQGVGAPTLPQPPKEAPTRTKDDPTPEEANAANAGELAGETRTVEGMGRNKGLKILGAVAATGAGAFGAYETIPAVHERVDSFLNSFTDTRLVPTAESNKADEVFDNGAEKGRINSSNINFLSQEEIDALPSKDESGSPIFLFPLVLNEQDSLEFKKTYYDGAAGEITLNVKANTPIIASHDGYAFVHRVIRGGKWDEVNRVVRGGEFEDVSINVTFMGDDGYAYTLRITNDFAVNPRFGLQASDSIPSLGPENGNEKYMKGKFVKKGEIMGIVAKDIPKLNIQLPRVKDGNFYEIGPKTGGDIVFATRDNKLAVRE